MAGAKGGIIGGAAGAVGGFAAKGVILAAGKVMASAAARTSGAAVEATKSADIAEGFGSFSAAMRALGSSGAGNVYEHVVEQSQIARSGFAPELVHNPYNMKPDPSDR